MLNAAILLLAGIAAATPADTAIRPQTGTLVVTVSTISGRSLEGVMVRIPEQERRARTDWIGEAKFRELPLGKHQVDVRHIGFAPAVVDVVISSDSTEVVFMLEQIVDTLGTIHVTAPWLTPHQRDFEQRRQKGIGRFVTEEKLVRHGFRDMAFTVPMLFPGVRAISTDGMRYRIESLRSASPATPFGCAGVDVYLDNLQIESEMIAVYPADLYGAEMYTKENVPPQYRRPGGGCHILLLWTKW